MTGAPELLGDGGEAIASAVAIPAADGSGAMTAGAGPAGNAAQLRRHFAGWREYCAHWLTQRADRARDRGDCATAAVLYRRALALDAGWADIRVQLAHMLKELARYGEAEAAYRQAMAQSPDDGDIPLQLGHLLKLLGRVDEAIAA